LNRNYYDFSLEELGEHIGLKSKNYSANYSVLNNALTLLYNSGLIDYKEFYDGKMQKKRLVFFGLEHRTKNG
jgi:hypothetical protein